LAAAALPIAGDAMDETSTTHRMPDEWCREHFDLHSPELAGTLWETLARMREVCPVGHSEEHGGYWVVTRYDDVMTAAQDWETYSSAHGLSIPAAPIAIRNIPVEVDPPQQRLYKRIVNPYFTPAAVGEWEGQTRQLVNRLVDGFVEVGRCEFMTDFARPYPALSFFDVALNAPPDDVEKVAYMASKSSTPSDPEAAECWAGLAAWITDFVAKRRNDSPRGDVVDGIISAQIDGRPITDEEIIGTIQLLILGGLETTAGALGHIFVRFCRQPEIPALLRDRPELIPKAVEELLRLDGPFISVGRTAMRDAELSGRHIAAGDKVLIHWGSANRDAEEFPDPESFDLDRERNRHLAFGLGPHRCLGSNLARMNLRIALEELLGRLDDIRLQDGIEIEYHSTLTRSPLRVPIAFTSR
jgi:cytochrome P450